MKLVPLFSLVLAACGGSGSDLDPGAGDDPGTGTSTLSVNGDVSAKPRLVNAREAGDFDTEVSVRVMRGLEVVTSGVVSITSSTGSAPLVFRTDTNRWEATVAGYDEVYELDVESGSDFVKGVRVDGPDLHFFTEPLAGASVSSTMPLKVTWDSDQTAASASIKAEEVGSIAVPDTGLYTLAAGALKAESDKPRENTLEITRLNRVTPAGALAGSQLSVSIENRLQVIAEANPAL